MTPEERREPVTDDGVAPDKIVARRDAPWGPRPHPIPKGQTPPRPQAPPVQVPARPSPGEPGPTWKEFKAVQGHAADLKGRLADLEQTLGQLRRTAFCPGCAVLNRRRPVPHKIVQAALDGRTAICNACGLNFSRPPAPPQPDPLVRP